MFRFDPEKLIKANYLGKGKFATVYPYDDEEKGKWVVKQVKTDKFLQASHHIQEIVLGFSCDHPNILGIKGFHIDFKEKEEKKVISEDEGKEKSQSKYKWIINMKIPRMKETLGDRYKSLNRTKRKFTQQELLYYFYNIVCGLEYLHEIKKIAHRNIKADNILLAKDQVKISDIGIAKFVGNEDSATVVKIAGTPINLAPELLGNSKLKNKELYKADIWSLGVLMANLCLIHMKSEQGDPEKSRINALESLKKEFSPIMIDLIINMLNHKPDARKPAKEIKRILEENFPNIGNKLIEQPSSYQPILSKKQSVSGMNLTSNSLNSSGMSTEPASKIKDVLSEEKFKQRPGDDIFDELFDSKDENKVAQDVQEESKSSNELGKVEEPQILENTEELCKRMGEAVNNLSQKWKANFKIFSRENFPGLAIQSHKADDINDQTVCDLLDDVRNEISEKNLQRAHGITIALGCCKKLTRVATSKIVDTINETFKNLLYLELDFWACNIKSMNEIMTELALKITAYHSSTLEQLGLSFAECLHVTDEGIKGLAQKVPQGLKKLKKLKLNFNRCINITNNGITELAKSIAILNSITEIDLMFLSCVNVNDQSLHVLGKEFAEHLKDLKMLNLVFSGCVDITGEGLLQFIQDIKVLKTLETFDLSLYQIEVEENIVSQIKNTLQHVKVVSLKLN